MDGFMHRWHATYTGAGGWGKIAAEISGGMLWRSKADEAGEDGRDEKE